MLVTLKASVRYACPPETQENGVVAHEPLPHLFGLLKQKDLVAMLGSSESTEISRLAQG